MTARRPSLVLALLLGALAPAPAWAQRRAPRPKPAPAAERAKTFKSELGLEAAKTLLRAEASSERVRGFERLSGIGNEAALEVLGRALDPGGAARDGRERLSAIRALAPLARVPVARAALVRALGASGSLERADPLLALARQTAALALARSGDTQALNALAQALRQPGRSAEAALIALSAYPPADLGPLLRARGAVSPGLLSLLEALDDPRTRGLLFEVARRGSPELRARAVLALARVQAPGAAELARGVWQKEKHPLLRNAAARALSLCGAPDAPQAVQALLATTGDDGLSLDAAIDIALESPAPALVPALQRALTIQTGERAERLLAALGRAGGPGAATALARALLTPERAPAAAYALSLSPGADARRALEQALAGRDPTVRRLALRAAALRAAALRDDVAGLEALAQRLLGAPDPADRAAATFVLALHSAEQGAALLQRPDLVIVRAAARAALAGGFARAAAERLERERDPLTRAALGIALADERASDRVSSATLEQMLDSVSPAAALAARAFAARDSDSLRPRIEQLLQSPDPSLRAHTALGLGQSQAPSAVGLLARAYRFESEAFVRRAIVIALSQRSEAGRLRVLELAAGFDPDAATRQSARLGLASIRLDTPRAGPGTLWLMVQGGAEQVAVLASPAPGLSLPALPDPDGLLAMAGLPAGSVEVRLAPAAIEGKGSGRRSP